MTGMAKRPATWAGTYRDERGTEPIVIGNDGDTLRVVIRGVEFTGSWLDGLEPVAPPPGAAPFTLHRGELCGCELAWRIPVPVTVGAADAAAPSGGAGSAGLPGAAVVDGVLDCRLRLAPTGHPNGGVDAEDLTLVLRYGSRSYSAGNPCGDVESALTALHRRLPPGTAMRTCVTCAWSDYSPGGNPSFGGLVCFRDNKPGYREVRTKADLFRIWDTMTGYVQETYHCDRYERRGPGAGYRGAFPPGTGAG